MPGFHQVGRGQEDRLAQGFERVFGEVLEEVADDLLGVEDAGLDERHLGQPERVLAHEELEHLVAGVAGGVERGDDGAGTARRQAVRLDALFTEGFEHSDVRQPA